MDKAQQEGRTKVRGTKKGDRKFPDTNQMRKFSTGFYVWTEILGLPTRRGVWRKRRRQI